MTTVKVKFRPSTVEGRPGTIVYFVTHRRVVRQITTGYKVFSHEWDDKQSRPVSAPAGERITVIQTIIRKLEENLEKLNRIIERFDLLRRGSGAPKKKIPFLYSWRISSSDSAN